jgi:hypothetical protein
MAFAVLAATSGATLAFVVAFEPLRVSPQALVAHAVLALTIISVLGVIFRRSLRASAHNRRVGLGLFVPALAFLLHRLVALRFDAPVPETLVGDILILAGICFVVGLTQQRWLYLGVPLALLYTLVVTLAPSVAVPGFGAVVLTLLCVGVWKWGEPRPRPRKKREDGVSGSSSGSRTSR